MERFVPDDWVGRFEDFATEFDDERFPSNEKFWVKDGVDLLSILNKRGANVKTK